EPTTPLTMRKTMMNEVYDRSMTTTTEASEFVSLLKSLRAVRQFSDRPLPAEAVRDIHDVIRWSGNASNRQEFEVLWVEDHAKLRQLSELKGYARHLAGAAAGAVIVTWMASEDLNAFDEGRIAERIMLAAHAYGIGSSIGMISRESRAAAQKILGVPEGRTVRTTISLGYPAEGALRGGRRKALAELVKRVD
ncbi:MAG TPA: nitroreductase family protein, partial [Dehalococcoidia bacterium]|nr:nitroreductase family protein [Dehalococcoidia bacterium]